MLDPVHAGDEPYLLAETLAGVPVLTGKKRYLPSRFAIKQLGVNCIILDDGFQHLALHRDFDIVLFNATDLAGNSRIFPGGPLREPVSALERCSCFLLTGKDDSNSCRADKFGKLLQQKFPDKLLYTSSLTSQYCVDSDGNKLPLATANNSFAFSGIANPGRFTDSLDRLGIQLTGFMPLKDHVGYTPRLVEKLSVRAADSGATSFITTEKDMVKLRHFKIMLPIYALRLEHRVSPDFSEQLLRVLQVAAGNSAEQALAGQRSEDPERR
jgi:tetraacyldisaccharide 4'-kinase